MDDLPPPNPLILFNLNVGLSLSLGDDNNYVSYSELGDPGVDSNNSSENEYRSSQGSDGESLFEGLEDGDEKDN